MQYSPILKVGCATLLATLLTTGCGWPRVHKVTVQQGNVISQEMIDKLTPGMTRSQVAFIMGEPVVKNSFNTDRWDYIYTIVVPRILEDEKRISLYFENDVLAYFTGDFAPSAFITPPEQETADADPEEG